MLSCLVIIKHTKWLVLYVGLSLHPFVLFFQAIGSILEFGGKISFTNNNAKGFDGGALHLLTSQIILNTGAHLEFVNNTGGYDTTIVVLCYHGNHHSLGASIVVNTGTIVPVFARNFHNPNCFIQDANRDLPPDQWEQVCTMYTQILSLYCYLY